MVEIELYASFIGTNARLLSHEQVNALDLISVVRHANVHVP